MTIEDVYEPYLLQIGFLQRTPRGRVVTHLAYQHFGMEVPVNDGIGKILMIIGVVIFIIGFLMQFIQIGKLPGDIVFKKGNTTFYFPIMTSILLSVVLIFNFLFYWEISLNHTELGDMMKVDLFDFHLPEELIAQTPLEDRTSSRLMVLNKETGKSEHEIFKH